jgi:hypothetical protein
MSYFARIENNLVTQVISAEQDFIDSGSLGNPADWKQTSYNTRGGVHYAPNSDTPDGGVALRGNYAGVGYTYDSTNDVFYPPQPYPSWTISSPTWTWTAPVAYPTDDKIYTWNEDSKSWDLSPDQPA